MLISREIRSFIAQDFIKGKVMPKGELLYLGLHGSRLYGCYDDNSDYDFKGVFLPNKEDILCCDITKSISLKGCVYDFKVEIEAWSLQHFLLHCLVKGDTNGIDVAYSWTNKDAVVLEDGLLFFKYLTVDTMRSYVLNNNMKGLLGYIVRQCDLYGIKGERLSELCDFIAKVSDCLNDHDRFGSIVKTIDISKYKHIKHTIIGDGNEALNVLGRLQPFYLRPTVVMKQLLDIRKTFGRRSESSMSGTDYKALSHAYRVCKQTLQLYAEGVIEFPLDCGNKLLDIKRGNCDISEVKREISGMLNVIDSIDPFDRDYVDINFFKFIINDYYK
jgi:hypothetical protein